MVERMSGEADFTYSNPLGDYGDIDSDERAFISKLEEDIRLPEDIRWEYERWPAMRGYVSDVGQSKDTPDTVTTNLILRTQFAVQANVMPRDPAPKLVPQEWVPESDLVPPIMAPQAAGQMGPDLFNDFPHEWTVYTKSQEIAVAKQQKLAGLQPVISGMVQDNMTLPIAWIKMRWIEDYDLDPIGMRHDNDTQVTAARYDSLKRAFDDEEFDEHDARHYEMHDIDRVLKDYLAEEVAVDLAENPPQDQVDAFGNPIEDDERLLQLRDLQSDDLLDIGMFETVPHYQGFCFESIDPEEVRFDWRVTKPEDMRFAWWMAQRVFMPPREIAEKWNLTSEEAEGLYHTAALYNRDGTPSRSGETEDKAGREERDRYNHIEDSTRGKFMAVWEYWDRRSGLVYRWVQGYGKLLDKFKPEGAPRRFFPFFHLMMNRATGKVFAPPDSELLRPLQEELNMLRTHDREARKSSYPRYMVTKGLLNKRAKQEMRTAVPYSVIEVEKANDVAQNIHELVPATYDPRLYDGSRARQDFEAMAGLSQSSLGMTGGAELATEAAIANQQLGIQSNMRKDTVIALYRDIYEAMFQMNAQRLDEGNLKALAGPGAINLGTSMEREQILNCYAIDIEASPNDEAEKSSELKKWLDATTVIQGLMLPINRIEISKEVLRLMGLRTNLSRFIDLAALLAPPPEQAPAGPGNANKPAGGGRPDQQGDEGAGGGRPEMSSQSGSPGPESVPNRPQV